MDYKYYFVFKNCGNGQFKFDNIIITNGDYIRNEGKQGGLDPEHDRKISINSYYYSFKDEIISFSDEIFQDFFAGGKEKLGYSRKSGEYKSQAKYLYISIDENFIKQKLDSYCASGLSPEDSRKLLSGRLYQIGDTFNFISLNKNNMTFYFKNDGNYSETPVRTEEFICKQHNIPYQKKSTMNGGGAKKSSKVTPNQSVKPFSVKKEQIPKILAAILKKVVAQDTTVQDVLYNIFMNQKILDTGNEDLINSNKANIILDGPTGTGKTLMLNLITEQLSIPFVKRAVTSFSTTGYKGADLNDLLIALLDAANGDLELAQRGVVALDEFDKLASTNSERDLVMKKALQEELLEYLSGEKFELEYNGKKIVFDTSKLTFIGLGAFDALRTRKIEENERKYNHSIGFSGANPEDYVREYSMTQEDYIDEGLMKELVGRFTTLTSTKQLSKEDLKKIIYESSLSPLKGLQELGKMENITITIEDEVVDRIVEMAYESGFGARGLQTLFNNIKNVVLKEILLGGVDVINIDMDLLNKSKQVSVRSY